ncbi:MAG: hypothetical protein AB7O59_09865 [Pirellulales bacterium]
MSIVARWTNGKMEAAGIEAESDFAKSNCDACGCADCEMCRAANALHSGRLQWLESALTDADLQRVILAWGTLPEAMRRAVLAIVDTCKK